MVRDPTAGMLGPSGGARGYGAAASKRRVPYGCCAVLVPVGSGWLAPAPIIACFPDCCPCIGKWRQGQDQDARAGIPTSIACRVQGAKRHWCWPLTPIHFKGCHCLAHGGTSRCEARNGEQISQQGLTEEDCVRPGALHSIPSKQLTRAAGRAECSELRHAPRLAPRDHCAGAIAVMASLRFCARNGQSRTGSRTVRSVVLGVRCQTAPTTHRSVPRVSSGSSPASPVDWSMVVTLHLTGEWRKGCQIVGTNGTRRKGRHP